MTTESDCALKVIDDCDGLTCGLFCEWSFAPADVNKVYECPNCGLDGDCTYCIFDSDKPAGYDDADKQGCLPRPGAARGDPRPLVLHASDARTRFRCTTSPGTDFGAAIGAIDDAVAGGLALAGAMLVRASLPRARTPLEPLGPRASARATRVRWQVSP